MQQSLKRLFRLPYFPIILAPVILFSGTLFTGRVQFWGLPALQFIPWRAFAWESLQIGVLPLWNPFNGLGTPLIANYQLALFYPPGWLVYLFAAIGGTQLMAWGHTLVVVLHLIWAGIGMVFFVRSLGLGELAQTISGLAFSLCGYLVARNDFYSIVWAAAWLPWILYAVNEIVNRERIRFSFKLLIFSCFQLLAGHAQVTWYSLLFAGVWLVILSLAKYGWGRALRSGLLFLCTMIASAGLTAIQLLPTAEFLLQSQRSAAVDYDLGLTYSFWPWRLLTFLSADFFGNPGNGTYLGYATYWEDAVYIGVIPFFLALTTLKNILPRRQGVDAGQKLTTRVLWGLILAGFILALGKNTPIFPFLYQYIPTFGLFNAPARWMLWAVFGLCALAGMGIEARAAPVGKAIRRNKIYIVISAAVAIGAGATWLMLKDVRLTFILATALTGVWGVIFFLASFKMNKEGAASHQRMGYVLAGLVALDLIAGQWSLVVTVPGSFYSPGTTPVNLETDQRVYLAYRDEYNIKFQRFFRIEDFNPVETWQNIWQTLLPNTNLLAKVPYVNDFDPLLVGRYATLINYLDQQPPASRSGFLQLLNVGSVEALDPTKQAGVQFTSIQGAGGRFQWASCGLAAGSEDEAWTMTKDLVNKAPKGEVVVEGMDTSTTCIAGGTATIVGVHETAQIISVQVNAGDKGWLVMADTWYPGWEATVDGKPVNIYRADYALRAIQVDGGRHEIVVNYRPISFILGTAITMAGWSIILIFILIRAIRKSFRNKL